MNNRVTRIALLTTLLFSSLFAANAPVDMGKRTKELQDLKWGMFICWSFSTFSGKEWTLGIKDVSFFKATGCDTDQWARTAKEAGMGYILFLTKHHDGFCLWDTKTTDRKVTKAPLGRDVLAELRKSCDKYGIKLAIYFSEGEWRSPGGFDDPSAPEPKKKNQGGKDPELKKAQLQELLTQYGPVEYIWFDHAAGDGGLSHEETIKWCKKFQPGCFAGFNHGDRKGALIRIGERGKPGPLNAAGKDFLAAEFTYPILPKHRGGADWFYSLPAHDGLCLPAQKLYDDYLGAVKYGNIFSINVGPDYNGKLREIDVKTLREVGDMIRNPPPQVTAAVPLSQGKTATAPSSWTKEYGPDKAVDGEKSTRWAAASGSLSGWLEVDLGKDEQVGHVQIIEQSGPRTKEFTVEYRVGDTWKELARGTTIGENKMINFPPVTARHVRLNILKASGVPTIDEFCVLPPSGGVTE